MNANPKYQINNWNPPKCAKIPFGLCAEMTFEIIEQVHDLSGTHVGTLSRVPWTTESLRNKCILVFNGEVVDSLLRGQRNHTGFLLNVFANR